MIGQLEFATVAEGVYRAEDPAAGIVLHVDRLRRKGGELIGELAVTCNLAGARRVTDEDIISAADFNFSSQRARQDRAAWLSKRALIPEYDWPGTIEYFCLRVIAAERSGQPSVLLRDVPKLAPDHTWTIHGLPILEEQPTILFGDGGSAKALLALAIAGDLDHRGIRTTFVDWETSAGDHRDRLESLFGPDMPAVRYVRAEWPLVHEVDRLRRLILAHDLEYLILDSVAFGCDGPPEAAESAAGYFRALRQLRVGALLIAHITKAVSGDQRPFGSAFWHNGARGTWFVERSTADGDASQMTLALHHRKANTGPLLSPRGLRVLFGERVEIRPTDLAEHDDFAAKLPTWQRMLGALRREPLTLAALAGRLDADVDTLDRTVRRKPKLFTRVAGGDGITRIALVERRIS